MNTKRPAPGARCRCGRSGAHIDNLLDEALKETFPPSDPIAIAVEEVRVTHTRHPAKLSVLTPDP